MIVTLILIVLVISILEIKIMLKKNLIKEIAVFLVLIVMAVGLGIFYLSNPYRESFTELILTLFNLQE